MTNLPHRRGLLWLWPWLLFVFAQSAGMTWAATRGSNASVYAWVDRLLEYESWAWVWGGLAVAALGALATGWVQLAYLALAAHFTVATVWGLSFADWALAGNRPDSWLPATSLWGVALASILWVWLLPRRYVGRGAGA